MLSCQKHQFSLPEGQHYLNCAYMAPLSRRVEAAGYAGLRRKRQPSTIQPQDFFRESDLLRQQFAQLTGAADPKRVAILPAVSYGVAVVARNTPVQRGQNIVTLHEQFPSNVYAWQRLAQERGASIRTVRPAEGVARRGPHWNERILEQIDRDTAVVALSHVHWADGTRFDLERIGARAREVGAALVVDGTQSVGALPFDVEAIRPDALICASYKWLLGPYSLALGYFGPQYDDGRPLEENWINRRGSENFSGLVSYERDYQPGALRYDVGERSNPILLPMQIAALEQIHEWGPQDIQAYCRQLTEDLVGEARSLGFVIEEAAFRGAHLFGLRVPPSVSIDELKAALDRQKVDVSVRGNAVRIAPNVYNDANDIAALSAALCDVAVPS